MTQKKKAVGSFLFLGTGASAGVPVIGCHCPSCTSSNPKNKRLRASVHIQFQEKSYLIDCGPDIRMQALKHNITKLDGLIVTHTHYDHIGGLEELRIFNFMQSASIPCVLSKESLLDLHKLFYYQFEKKEEGEVPKNFTSHFDFQVLSEKTGKTQLGELPVQYTSYYQGQMRVLGLRFGSLAYISDIKDYSEDIFPFLKGVETLVVSALRTKESKLHFTLDEAIEFAKKVGGKETYFMHISHELEYDETKRLLPEHIHLAYDGLKLPFHIES